MNDTPQIKSLISHAGTYGIAEFLRYSLGFLMIPVYTRYLTPSDYGVMAIVHLTIGILSIVLSMRIGDSIYRFYHDTDDPQQQRSVLSTACLGIPIISGVVVLGAAFFSNSLAYLILGEPQGKVYLILGLGELWCNLQISLFYSYLMVNERSVFYLVIAISKFLTAMLLNIYLIVFLQWGVLGFFISNLTTATIFLAVTYPYLLYKLGLCFSMATARKMLRYSLPIIPSSLSTLAVNQADRYFIRTYLSMADVGIYSLATKFGNIPFTLIRVPFMQIWVPRRYALYNAGVSPEFYARIATYFIFLMTFCGLSVSILIRDGITYFASQAFWPAAAYTPALVLCYIIYSLDSHVDFGIRISKKTELYTYVNLTTAILHIGLNYLLIPMLGLWGAAVTMFMSLVGKIVGLHLISRDLYRVPFEWLRIGGIILIASATYLVSSLFHTDNVIPSVILDFLLVLSFPYTLWLSGLVSDQEKISIINGIKYTLSMGGRAFAHLRGQ